MHLFTPVGLDWVGWRCGAEKFSPMAFGIRDRSSIDVYKRRREMHSRMFSAGWCQGGKNSIKSAGGGKLQILGRVQLGMYYYDQDTIQDTILVLRWFLISLVLLL